MEDFETQIREMVAQRRKREDAQDESDLRNGEYEYTKFKCWCNAFKNGQGQNNAKVFAEYLKEEGKELDFWAKKHLAEKYFGFEYEYDSAKDDWNVKKRKLV